MNKKLFIEAMKNNGDNMSSIAKYLEISRPTLYDRLDKGEFNNVEIEKLKVRWKLTPFGVDKIFIGGKK